MANDLQQTRYDQLVRRVGGIIGPGSKVAEALPELFPMIDVENVPGKLLLLGGTRLCMGRTSTAGGGAGNFGIHLLRNNAGSGVVATLTALVVGFGVGSNFNLGPTENSGTPGGTRAFVDGRVFGEGTALITQQDNNSLVTGSLFGTITADAQGFVYFEVPKALGIITPGNAFSVSNATANEALRVTWFWRERQALESEFNL